MNHNTRLAQTFIGLMIAAGIASSIWAGTSSHSLHLPYALAVGALAAATSRMKVKLPGINGTMSVNMPFFLIAVVNLSAVEAVAIACVSTVVQCWPKREAQFKPMQMLFNVSMMACAASMASLLWHSNWLGRSAWASEPLMLASATATFFLGQTAPVAGIITLTEGTALRRIWMSLAQLSFPYYVVSAGVTTMVNAISHHAGWKLALAAFPVMFAIYKSYQLYFGYSRAASVNRTLIRSAGAGM
jgi:MASE9